MNDSPSATITIAPPTRTEIRFDNATGAPVAVTVPTPNAVAPAFIGGGYFDPITGATYPFRWVLDPSAVDAQSAAFAAWYETSQWKQS